MPKQSKSEHDNTNQFWIFFFMLVCMLVILNLLGVSDVSAGNKKQIVAGAGPSTKIVTLFMELLSKTGVGKEYQFTVPENSIKHAGGIRSTKKYIFGRTGRPLNDQEKSRGFEELILGKMPIAFVAGRENGVQWLKIDQICAIFTGKTNNWHDVGGNDHEVIIFSREPTEALLQVLKKELPCMRKLAKTRFIFKKDHHLVQALKTHKQGVFAISFGAEKNFSKEFILNVEGFSSGVDLGLVFRSVNRNHPLVQEAKELVQSGAWQKILLQNNLGLPSQAPMVAATPKKITLYYPPAWKSKTAQAKAISKALAKNSGLNIRPRIAKSYPQILESFMQDKPVLVYVGSFVQAVLYARGLSTPIAQAINGSEFYTSILIAPREAGDDPRAIVADAGHAIAYTMGASSGESGAKAASNGKATIGTHSHFAAVNLVKAGKAKAAFVKNWWWIANKNNYPNFEQREYPGVSDHRHPDYVLSANKATSPEDIARIKHAIQKTRTVFNADSVVTFEPSLLEPTLDLMDKGGINPMTYSWNIQSGNR